MNEANQHEQDSKHLHRHSYLLRLWRTTRSGSSYWHASLEDPRTNERVGFASLEQLFAFLMSMTESDEKRVSK